MSDLKKALADALAEGERLNRERIASDERLINQSNKQRVENADRWFVTEMTKIITEQTAKGLRHARVEDRDHADACLRAGLKVEEHERDRAWDYELWWVVSW
jgi:hypothetical protein